MFSRNNKDVKNRLDVNHYTARRLGDMAESLNQRAKAFDDEIEKNGQLSRGDGLAAMQASATLVCENCSQCNLYADSEKEDSYYLYYLLRAFEQKGHIDHDDMPQMFQTGCRKQDAYLAQLNRSLGRATMNLSWKNRFLESRDAVVSQFREMSVILEEFSHQIDQARDITEEYEYIIKKYFRKYHMAVGNLLLLEYENGQKEAFLTVRTTNGRCVTSKEAAELMGDVVDDSRWRPAGDSRSIITKQYATIRLLEDGGYHLIYGASRIPRQGERYSGDNYTFCESQGSQVVMSLSDGMGSGETASKESRQVVELTEQAGQVPMGIINGVEPVLMSRKMWDGNRIVMVSDGVLDALPGDDKEQVMKQYLESVEEMGPQELADQILEFAVSFIPAPRDDMTVLTAGLWKRHS